MGAYSNFSLNAVSNAWKGTAFTVPATLYLGFSTTTVAADGTGITEPVGNGYVRLAVAMNATTWTVTTNAITNAIALTTATASGNWGVLTDAFLYSTASGAGTLYVFDVLAVARTVTSGEALTVAAGDFDFLSFHVSDLVLLFSFVRWLARFGFSPCPRTSPRSLLPSLWLLADCAQ